MDRPASRDIAPFPELFVGIDELVDETVTDLKRGCLYSLGLAAVLAAWLLQGR